MPQKPPPPGVTRRPAAPIAACGVLLALLAVVALSRHRPAQAVSAPPRRHEAIALETPAADPADPRSGEQLGRLLEAQPMDLNRATATELEVLPRIGPTLAARIVADRELRGPYRGLSDLSRVRGIGPRTVERLAPLLTVPAD